jgi:hypothetical protein
VCGLFGIAYNLWFVILPLARDEGLLTSGASRFFPLARTFSIKIAGELFRLRMAPADAGRMRGA